MEHAIMMAGFGSLYFALVIPLAIVVGGVLKRATRPVPEPTTFHRTLAVHMHEAEPHSALHIH